jgi:nitric oxide dioxygenase
MLTIESVRLIKESWAKVSGSPDAVAALFYARLFETSPELKPLFRGDIREQGRKLMQTLGVVVQSADRLDDVLPAVAALGTRHVAYGVLPEDYAKVGAALLWTLEQGLGEGFTPAVREAWSATFGALSSVMIEAAREPAHR